MTLRRLAYWVAVAVAMLPALVLTGNRLVEPHLGLAIQAQAFTPFAIPLYLLATLLLLGGAVAHRVRHGDLRTPAGPAAVVALAGFALHAWWFAPMLTDDAPAVADGAEPIAVMAANLYNGQADATRVVELVRQHDVEVLAAVEVTPRSLAALDSAGLDDLLPHRAGETGEEGTPDGTMVLARTPIVDVTVLPTVMTSVLATVEGQLSVMAVHPSPPIEPDRWRDDLDAVVEAAREHRPDVILGDFNATHDHRPMRALADAGYRDSIELTGGGFQPTWPNNGGVGLIGAVSVFGPVAQIDHVLVSGDHTVAEAAIHDLAGSDHRVVTATVAERSREQ